MRQLLSVAIVGGLSGCSLIYNPGNLPAASPHDGGVEVDAEIILDADPALLALEGAFPATLDEGAGVDGSRPALLVLTGTQMVPGATISVMRSGGGTTTAVVDNTKTTIAADGKMMYAPITIGIDGTIGPSLPTKSYKLDIIVTQAGTVTRMLPGAVTVQGYDELMGAAIPAGAHTYSQVAISGAFTAATSTEPLVVRSNSSITIAGPLTASAVGSTGGPGGGGGGSAGTTTATAGDGGGGAGKGLHNNGGGGYGTAGGAGSMGPSATAGDAAFKTLADNHGAGGAGGAGGVGTGGVGGGGGGTVELSARGNLTIAGIANDGAKGTAGNGGIGTTDGGSGSGGGVLLRSGNTLSATGTISVAGAAATSKGAAGGDGRVRLDAPTSAASVTSTVPAYRGPMFATSTPLVVRTKTPTLSITCQHDAKFTYFILDEKNNLIEPLTSPLTCGPAGTEDIDFDAKGSPLGRGVNQICLLVDGATRTDNLPEDRNCISLVFLYQP